MRATIYDPGTSSLLPGWRWLHATQPISDRTSGVGVSTPYEAVSIRGINVFVPGLSESWMYEMIYHPGMRLYAPPVALMASRNSQPSVIQLVGCWFPYRAGWYRTGASPFPSPVCGSRRKYMEGFMTRIWHPILPGLGWLHESKPISDQSEWDGGFHTVRGGADRGDRCFRPWFVCVVDG